MWVRRRADWTIHIRHPSLLRVRSARIRKSTAEAINMICVISIIAGPKTVPHH